MAGSERHDFSGLNKFVKAMSGTEVVQVGILGEKSVRNQDVSNDNAAIGAIHEFGSYTRKIPARSFLRMPLFHKAEDIRKSAAKGAEKLLAQGNRLEVMRRLGTAAVAAIMEAFATRGFGSWLPDAPGTIKAKGSSSPLIDTGQLRRSISFRVVAR